MQKKRLRCRIIADNPHLKKCLLLTVAIGASAYCSAQIPDGIFGQNANLTSTVGTNTSAGGHLDEYWDRYGTYNAQNYILESKTKFMRYGGIQVENDCNIGGFPTNPLDHISITIADYIAKAIAMQDNGITPMMTLPLKYGGSNPIPDLATSATKVALLVKGVNDGLTATTNTHLGGHYAPVVYWVYSNEPEGSGHNFNPVTTAADIYSYISAYYTAVTNSNIWNSAWGAPKFVGPELWDFDDYVHYDQNGNPNGLNNLIYRLSDCATYPATCIMDYVSIFTFHFYPFGNEGNNTKVKLHLV